MISKTRKNLDFTMRTFSQYEALIVFICRIIDLKKISGKMKAKKKRFKRNTIF